MSKHRALIVGAGRIGSGFGWKPTPYIYTHADAYLALRERVELLGFVEPDSARMEAAERKYKLPVYQKLSQALLDHLKVDVVSICTNPDTRKDIFGILNASNIKGIWTEKPYALTELPSKPTQVNYCRRFEKDHEEVYYDPGYLDPELIVIAKKDEHTVSHFTDLARYWRITPKKFHYYKYDGPNSYLLRWKNKDGEYEGERHFPLGGMNREGGFMEGALGNLLDHIEGQADLKSSAENAIESEKWANEILEKA